MILALSMGSVSFWFLSWSWNFIYFCWPRYFAECLHFTIAFKFLSNWKNIFSLHRAIPFNISCGLCEKCLRYQRGHFMCIINLIRGVKTTNWPKVTQLVSGYGYGHFHLLICDSTVYWLNFWLLGNWWLESVSNPWSFFWRPMHLFDFYGFIIQKK